jgi:hypothetical protein
MPDLGKNGGKMPDLVSLGPNYIIKNKNAIKIDRAGIAIFANYEVLDLDLIEPEIRTPM